MTRNRTTYQDIILFRENLYHFQDLSFLHGHLPIRPAIRIPFITRLASDELPNRTRSSLTIMLTVRLLTHTMETMTFNNTLETFTFCSTYYFNFFAFSENVNSNGFTNIFFERKLRNSLENFLGEVLCFCEVIFFRLD